MSGRNWSWPGSVLFAFTVYTTIGYGNFSVETAAGRFFVIFYALFGFGLWGMAVGALSQVLVDLGITPLFQKLQETYDRKQERDNRTPTLRVDADDHLKRGQHNTGGGVARIDVDDDLDVDSGKHS